MILDNVWETYGQFPAYQLSALTHDAGTPWTTIFEHGRNRPIPDSTLQAQFQQFLQAA